MRYEGKVHDDTVSLLLRWIAFRERAAAPKAPSWVRRIAQSTVGSQVCMDDVESMGYCYLALSPKDQDILARKYAAPMDSPYKPGWRKVLRALTRLQELAEQKGLVPPPETHERNPWDEEWEFPTL